MRTSAKLLATATLLLMFACPPTQTAPMAWGWRLKAPTQLNANLYRENADAKAEIREALAQAAAANKRVLVVFGANWCYDCHVLDAAFHDPQIEPLLQAKFLVVHVDVGEFDKNTALADKYQVPLKRGIPAIAVLDADGKLLFSQKNGEFESARTLSSEDVLKFLNRWKSPSRAPANR